jgi:hypothetical protein
MEAEQDAYFRSIPVPPLTIADSRLKYTFSEDGSVGSVKLRISRDPRCCVFAHFDRDDLDWLVPYTLHGLKCENRLQPFLCGRSPRGEALGRA